MREIKIYWAQTVILKSDYPYPKKCISFDTSIYKPDTYSLQNQTNILMKTLKIFINASLLLILSTTTIHAQSGVFKNPVSFKLKNGLKVIVAENTSTMKVYSSFTVDAPDEYATVKPGVEELLVSMLHKTAVLEEAGISFNEKGGNLATNVAGFEYSLNAFSNTIRNPFNSEVFEQAKLDLIASVNSHTKYYAVNVNETTVTNLTLDDVKAFYRSTIRPVKATLTIVGNLTPAEAKHFAKKAFEDWQNANIS